MSPASGKMRKKIDKCMVLRTLAVRGLYCVNTFICIYDKCIPKLVEIYCAVSEKFEMPKTLLLQTYHDTLVDTDGNEG